MTAKRTQEDLREKLLLERAFERNLKMLNNKIVKKFKKDYMLTGMVLNAYEFRDEIESMLSDHYENVGRKFSSKLSPLMPEEVAPEEDEFDKIFEALSLYYITRAGQQSLIITETNQKNISDAVVEGDELARETEGEFSRITAASFAAVILARKLSGRRKTIVVTETQNIAETAKITEAEVLSGLNPSITGASTVKKPIMKEWFSVGDDAVRQTHIEADGQRVDINEAFVVGGEFLFYPGDTNRGATMKEIAGCRCSSQVDVDSLVEHRKK